MSGNTTLSLWLNGVSQWEVQGEWQWVSYTRPCIAVDGANNYVAYNIHSDDDGLQSHLLVNGVPSSLGGFDEAGITLGGLAMDQGELVVAGMRTYDKALMLYRDGAWSSLVCLENYVTYFPTVSVIDGNAYLVVQDVHEQLLVYCNDKLVYEWSPGSSLGTPQVLID